MSGPFPFLLQCVFYNVNYLCSFPDLHGTLSTIMYVLQCVFYVNYLCSFPDLHGTLSTIMYVLQCVFYVNYLCSFPDL